MWVSIGQFGELWRSGFIRNRDAMDDLRQPYEHGLTTSKSLHYAWPHGNQQAHLGHPWWKQTDCYCRCCPKDMLCGRACALKQSVPRVAVSVGVS